MLKFAYKCEHTTNIDSMDPEFLRREGEAVSLAENFVKCYYECADRMRHKMARLYMEGASLIWNGNGVCGNQVIQEFYEHLPSTDHDVVCVDCQPLVQGVDMTSEVTYVLKVYGNVSIAADPPKRFHQNLLIATGGDKMKIVSDCYRFNGDE